MSDTTHGATRRRQNTRARLLDAAHEVFGEVGMDAASVEAICERAGFTRGAFYSNFESKEDLFLALITQLSEGKLDEVAARVRELDPAAPMSIADLVHAVMGVSFGKRMEPRLLSGIRTQALRDPRLAAVYLGWQDGMIARVERIVDEVADAYGLRLRLPAAELARTLVEISDDTCVRGAIEGRDDEAIGGQLNERLAMLAEAFIVRD